MTNAARIAALAGGSALAVFAATRFLGGGGAPDDVGLVAVRDVLIERDSQTHEGQLEGCNASSCELGDRHYERRALAFVGLTVETPTPPPVEDPAHDELHLRGGGVAHEKLARIDDDAVFAGARRFERGEVDWIYLAPEPERPGPQAAQETQPEAEPAPQRPPQPPPPPPPQPQPQPEPGDEPRRPEPRPPPPEDAAFQGCPDDRPLGAWIWLRNDYQDFRPPNCKGTETQVVRFRLEADPGSQLPGSPVALAYSAKELRYSVSTDGCLDVDDRSDDRICNADGAFAEGTLPLSVENLGFAKFFPLEPQLSFQYPTPPTWPFQLTVHCLHHPTGIETDHTVEGFNEISINPGECAYPQRECSDYCVAPTVCKDPTGAPQDCYLKPERYAVIPFEGAIVDGPEREERGLCVIPGSSQIRWRACCGCAETGPPPDFNPRPPVDPCENAAAELAALVGRLRGLAEAYRSHEDSLRCAEAGREAARDRIWGVSGSWAQYFASLPWVATTGVKAPAGGRAEMLDNSRRIISDLIEYARAVQEGRTNVEGGLQWLIDMAGTTQAWRNAEDPMRGEYARAWAAAKQLAEQFLRRNPGDLKGAAQIFDEDFAARAARISPRRGLNAFGALRNLSAWSSVWEHSSDLVHDVSVYFAWKGEEERARHDMETTQDSMRDVQAQIDALRARCPDLPPGSGVPIPDPTPQACPDVPPGHEDLRTDSAREADAAAQRAIPGAPGTSDVLKGVPLDAPAAGSGPSGAAGGTATAAGESGDAERVRAAQQRLDAAVQRMGARMAERIVPRLAPLLLGVTEAREPAYVAVLMEKAGAELQALMPDLEQASAAAEEIQKSVEALRPPEAATPGSR